MTSLERADSIQSLASSKLGHLEVPDAHCSYHTESSVSLRLSDIELHNPRPKSPSRDERVETTSSEADALSKEQKKMRKIIVWAGGFFVLLSLIVVGVTLFMAEHIDELAKKALTTTPSSRVVQPANILNPTLPV